MYHYVNVKERITMCVWYKKNAMWQIRLLKYINSVRFRANWRTLKHNIAMVKVVNAVAV